MEFEKRPPALWHEYILVIIPLQNLTIKEWLLLVLFMTLLALPLQYLCRSLDALSSEAVEVYCLPQINSLGNTSVAVPILDLYTNKRIYQEQPWNSAEGQERAQKVSLRFTWELEQPDYYRLDKYSGLKLPLVIIASEPVSELPPELKKNYPAATLSRQFTKSSGVFRFQTFVSVIDPN